MPSVICLRYGGKFARNCCKMRASISQKGTCAIEDLTERRLRYMLLINHVAILKHGRSERGEELCSIGVSVSEKVRSSAFRVILQPITTKVETYYRTVLVAISLDLSFRTDIDLQIFHICHT